MFALLWALNRFLHLPGRFNTVLNLIVLACAAVWLLTVYDIIG